jgi:HPt (histidine-containing phosphotransfer) domain-containing protein
MTGFVSKPFEPADLYQKILALTTGRVSSPSLLTPEAEDGTKKDGGAALTDTPPLKPIAQAEQIVDLSYLTELSGDDPAYLREVVSIFLSSVPQNLEHLSELVREGTNREAICKTAHGLKSSFGVVRVKGFLERLAEIEDLASGSNGQEDLQRVMRSLNTDFRRAQQELQAMIDTA